ncbi:YqaA family protein [Aestuariispira insulae]|uniref:Membrane protein YqaA with SNARE-associated domain n=1 Tax=Aestuariispira insulae TaxID=1461337 RepID=A0A3D9HP99_9PROT|nr:YqaA family protein [Aestuariispira insulae]RED51289.1 membrane protein YqaA with SNARE-associated domain [Aestuariispira insulae]
MNPFTPLRRLYDWTLELAAHPHAIWWLALIAFAESSFFPIPQDIMMIPMILAAREKAFQIAFVATVASVAGGVAGYLIGAGLFETVGQQIIAFYGAAEKYETFQQWYLDYGGWIVAGGAFTPIPYKVITIASGAMGMDLASFTGISIVGRGGRFFLLALALYYFGAPIRRLIEERFGLMTTAVFTLLVGGFLAIKFVG